MLQDHVDNEDREDGVTIRDAIGRTQKATFAMPNGKIYISPSTKFELLSIFERRFTRWNVWISQNTCNNRRWRGGLPCNLSYWSKMLTLLKSVKTRYRHLGPSYFAPLKHNLSITTIPESSNRRVMFYNMNNLLNPSYFYLDPRMWWHQSRRSPLCIIKGWRFQRNRSVPR